MKTETIAELETKMRLMKQDYDDDQTRWKDRVSCYSYAMDGFYVLELGSHYSIEWICNGNIVCITVKAGYLANNCPQQNMTKKK